ncbi:MAG: apolipoprotein N-acyltransferase [Omnitrophica bacterium RIFCSPHIGHO2_02_FULL_51_18]|nr:MAG: apolipoprotein N-acyltransferase [Omnitrophica bacterium RIFCSPHIGHO2_02_FULL_51_18]
MPHRLRDLLLVIISAVLLVLPYHFDWAWPFAYVAFIPYFFALNRKSSGGAFKYSYLFGFLFFCFLGYWLIHVNVVGFIALAAYLALYFAFFGLVSVRFLYPADETERSDTRKAIPAVFFIAAFWVVGEYLRGWIASGLPWALLSYGQWKNLWVIQISDITGCYGVSFFVMLVNLLIYKILRMPKTRLAAVAALILLGSVLTVCAYGLIVLNIRDSFYKSASAEKKQIRVSVVQGNIPQDQKWDRKIKNIIFEKYKRLTFMSATEKPDLILWPETSFPGYFEDEPLLAAQLRSTIRQAHTDVLVGAPTLGDLERGLQFYNTAILFGPDGEERKRYHKVHLVPFGEFVPFEPALGFLRKFFAIGHFSAGNEKTIFETQTRTQNPNRKFKFAALICYEDIFPGLVREFCLAGADFLVNVTNDAWFGKTAAPYQHAQGSLFRAVENRVPVVRAANTGLSCFISPEGRILASVKDNGKEIFVTGHQGYTLTIRKTPSFYTRFGDVFVALMFLLCFLAYRHRSKHTAYSEV